MKPDNLLVDEYGNLKLDFRSMKNSIENLKKAVPFIRSYAALEAIDREYFSSKCDVYSVGVILFELAYGHHPLFPKNGPRSIGELRERIQNTKE